MLEKHIPSDGSASLPPNDGRSPILSACKALFPSDMPVITIPTLLFTLLLMFQTKKYLFLLPTIKKMLQK